jgi:putative aldouronate transport system permease protein
MKKAAKVFGRNYQLYILLLPAIIYVVIFYYGPMYGVLMAFKDYHTNMGILGSPWVGLEHFARFVNYPDFKKLILNTLLISVYSILTFPCPLIFALFLSEIKSTGIKKTIQMVSYYPYFLSSVVVCGIIKLFFSGANGLLGNLLESAGFARIDLLANPDYFRSVYVWSGVWQSLGWNSIIYFAALAGVSEELIEAANLDGASRLQIIWHVKLPTIAPTVIIMLILSTGGILSVGFDKIYLLQNPLNLDVSEVISTYVYKIGLVAGQFSYSAAIGLFNNIVNILVLLFVNEIAKRTSEISVW